jgi:membrane-bound serine protease (ClpP class)
VILAVVLVLLGFGFVIAEVFFPSMGILSLVAGTLILVGDIMAFEQGGTGWGFALVAIEVVLLPLVVRQAFRWLPRLPFGRRMLLQGPATRPGAGLPDLGAYLGREGVALTDLRPGGMARFGEERVSVVSRVGHLDRDTPVVVVAVEGPEVRVAPARRPPA